MPVPEYDHRLLAIAPQYPAEGFAYPEDEFAPRVAAPDVVADASPPIPPTASPPPPVQATSISPDHTTFAEEKESQIPILHSTKAPWWRRRRWYAAFILFVIAAIAGIVVGVICGTKKSDSDSNSSEPGVGAPQTGGLAGGTSTTSLQIGGPGNATFTGPPGATTTPVPGEVAGGPSASGGGANGGSAASAGPTFGPPFLSSPPPVPTSTPATEPLPADNSAI